VSENRFVEKIDYLDMLINVLMEHEVKLSELTERIEAVASILENYKV